MSFLIFAKNNNIIAYIQNARDVAYLIVYDTLKDFTSCVRAKIESLVWTQAFVRGKRCNVRIFGCKCQLMIA